MGKPKLSLPFAVQYVVLVYIIEMWRYNVHTFTKSRIFVQQYAFMIDVGVSCIGAVKTYWTFFLPACSGFWLCKWKDFTLCSFFLPENISFAILENFKTNTFFVRCHWSLIMRNFPSALGRYREHLTEDSIFFSLVTQTVLLLVSLFGTFQKKFTSQRRRYARW